MTQKTLPGFAGVCALPAVRLSMDYDPYSTQELAERFARGNRLKSTELAAQTINGPHCSFETTDHDQWAQHMTTMHGRRQPKTSVTGIAFPGKGLWKGPRIKEDQAKLDTLSDRLTSITWTVSGRTRTGQFWSEAPGKDRIWAVPHDRTPNEPAAVLLERRTQRVARLSNGWETVWVELP